MHKYLFYILFFAIFINSCSFYNNVEKSLKKIKNYDFFIKKQNSIFLDFNDTSEKIILEMLHSNNILITKNTLLFLNTLKNKTNIILDKKKLTNIIKNKIVSNSKKIVFIRTKKINNSKKKLGLSDKNDSINMSTAILLSRNNNVKYCLYSYVSGESQPFLLTVELILVKTGEIVFSKTENFFWS